MALPIVILVGPAGSGKDTAADIIVNHFNGARVALADPIKRFIAYVFQFPHSMLWGPSEERNRRFPGGAYVPIERWWYANERLGVFAEKWLREMLPDADDHLLTQATAQLYKWFDSCRDHYKADPEGDTNPTARYLLQTLGTEFGRSLRSSLWIDYAISLGKKLLTPGYRYSPERGAIEDLQFRGYDSVVISDGRFRNEVLGVKGASGIALGIRPPGELVAANVGITNHRSEQEQLTIPPHFFDAIVVNDKSHGIKALEASLLYVMGNMPGFKMPPKFEP